MESSWDYLIKIDDQKCCLRIISKIDNLLLLGIISKIENINDLSFRLI